MDRFGYERQGTGYDPHAVGYELQGRDKAPSEGTDMKQSHYITPGSTSTQPGAVTQRMNQGINQRKAIAMQGLPEPVRRKK